MRCVAGLALVGEVVPRIVRAARECHTPHGRMPLGPIFNPYRVVAVRAVAPKLVKAVVGEGQVIVVIPAGDATPGLNSSLKKHTSNPKIQLKMQKRGS